MGACALRPFDAKGNVRLHLLGSRARTERGHNGSVIQLASTLEGDLQLAGERLRTKVVLAFTIDTRTDGPRSYGIVLFR